MVTPAPLEGDYIVIVKNTKKKGTHISSTTLRQSPTTIQIYYSCNNKCNENRLSRGDGNFTVTLIKLVRPLGHSRSGNPNTINPGNSVTEYVH